MPSNHGTHPAAGPRPVELPARPGVVASSALSHSARGESRASKLTAQRFGELFDESWKILWCAAVAVVRDRTLAQDVVQQAAIVGLKRLNDFEPDTSFVSWMTRIVKNIALNESRKRVRRRTSPTEGLVLDTSPAAAPRTESPAVTGSGHIAMDQAAFDDRVTHALEGLDETARSCLLLRVVLDLPYREIALALDIPEGTAASHVHRARKLLRERLQSEGGRP